MAHEEASTQGAGPRKNSTSIGQDELALLVRSAAFVWAPSPMAVIDADFQIRAYNRAFETLFGSGDNRLCYSVLKGHEEVCSTCPVSASLADGEEHGCDEQLVSVNGDEVPMRVCAHILDPSRGFALHIGQNRSSLERLEKELRQAERLATVGMTTAGLAHTIKNILSGLEGGIYMVDSGIEKEDGARLGAGWKMVRDYIDQISGLVKNLLRYSKAETPEKVPMLPGEIVEEVYRLFAAKAELIDVRLETRIADGVEPIELDVTAIHACLSNLVENALDACTWDPDYEKDHQVLVAVEDLDGTVSIEVRDNGSGISCENQSKVLATQFTTKGIRGTGLGLLLTRKAVLEHGGTLSFESEPGAGTAFRIDLPRASANASEHHE